MPDISKNNREAWEYKVYEWRCKHQGKPEQVSRTIVEDPRGFLGIHSEFFEDIENLKIASICGSDGRKALALASLGAKPTVFDISEPQMKYAMELAGYAGLELNYELGDFNQVDTTMYDQHFDKLYCEGGILHYFYDLDRFYNNCFKILKRDGIFVLSDFHPFRKGIHTENPTRNVELTGGNYFDHRIHTGHVPYAKYFPKDIQLQFPKCQLRFYTLSEIINGAVSSGFEVRGFYEHPKYNDPLTPGEFTLLLKKN